MIDFILIFLASAMNAVMDTTQHHYTKSIFNSFKQEKWRLWFNTDGKSWKNVYIDRKEGNGKIKWSIFGIKFNKPVQIADAWHFFKMIMIFLICLLPVFDPIIYFENSPMWNLLLQWVLLGITWILTFNVFVFIEFSTQI